MKLESCFGRWVGVRRWNRAFQVKGAKDTWEGTCCSWGNASHRTLRSCAVGGGEGRKYEGSGLGQSVYFISLVWSNHNVPAFSNCVPLLVSSCYFGENKRSWVKRLWAMFCYTILCVSLLQVFSGPLLCWWPLWFCKRRTQHAAFSKLTWT